VRKIVGYSLFGAVMACLNVTAGAAALSSAEPSDPAGLRFFEARIRPVLVQQCYKCHSSTAEKLKGGLLLDTRAGLLRGGDSGKPSIVPGDPHHSLLLDAIRYTDPDLQMPPRHELPGDEIADFEAWVKMGAPDPRTEAPGATTRPIVAPVDVTRARTFWSFQPPKPQPVPTIIDSAWPQTDIDRFILARLESKGIAPAPQADKHTLIRRATFDLTGLPPTPDEVDAFGADSSADAFAKVVDRLLASPAYGERWGRHWLDLARYADTGGDSADYPVPQAYRYRNWVIDAFNRDEPYDQFVREQVAGDLLPSKDEGDRKQKIIATGYLAVSKRFSTTPEGQMHLTIDDTIDTLGRSVLGLTMGCARCHDHKFDPIGQRDYYALYGIFASTRYPMPGSETSQFPKDMAPLAPQPEASELRSRQDEIDEADAAYRKLKRLELLTSNSEEAKKLAADLREAKAKLNGLLAKFPPADLAYAVTEATPVDANILRRGEPLNKGEVAPRGFPAILGGQTLPATETGSGRLELADWLTNPANPLTARVMVNRIWQYHFGRGIVATPSDFGARGKPPTHPELLDYLALRFVKDGWSVKAMHRAIMLSAVYQLADAGDSKAVPIDPTNELCWHFERRRLEAEEVRDSILALSGQLDRSIPGPHPFPPPSQWSFSQHKAFSAVYESNHRGVYLMVQRLKQHPFLGTFDGADANATTATRGDSTTPLQALFMMNDAFVYAQSAEFAKHLLADAPDDAGRVDLAYRRALGRAPLPEEVAAGADYLRRYRQALPEQTAQAQRDRDALASLARVLFGSNEFMYVD
jgi:hypothetical protein